MDSQKATEGKYLDFLTVIAQIDDDYVRKVQDIKARLNIIRQAAGETSPLPNFRLKELENIIENVGQNQMHIKQTFHTNLTR